MFRPFSSVKCVFCFTSCRNCNLSLEKSETPNWLLIFFLHFSCFYIFLHLSSFFFMFLHVSSFSYFSSFPFFSLFSLFFLFFSVFLFSSIFCFVFPFSFFSSSFSFSFFCLFQASEQTPKPAKNRREVPVVKRTIFL